jgi:hypothetical protein
MAPLFEAVQANHEKARKLRRSAQEARAAAKLLTACARSLRQRVRRLDNSLALANSVAQYKRTRTSRDEALDALKQSLRDLESLRMTTRSEDLSVSKLKADIRETLNRAR